MQPYRLQEISPGDYDGIWSLYTSVGSYFRRFQPFPSSLNEALADLRALPPGVEPTAKHTFALYEKDQLIALLDFIWNYPAPNMMYLGLLLVHGTFQGERNRQYDFTIAGNFRFGIWMQTHMGSSGRM